MKCWFVGFCSGMVLCCGHAANNSLLTAQKFPKTFDDLSFVSKIQVLAQGYEPWESEYDDAGNCISGCAYQSLTLDEELMNIEKSTQRAMKELRDSGYLPVAQPTVTGTSNVQFFPVTDVKVQENAYVNNKVLTPKYDVPVTVNPIVNSVRCSPNNPKIQSGQVVPRGEPVANDARISSPFGKRVHPTTGKVHVHHGVDLAVPMGTDVFSPAQGVVASVTNDSTCGNGLRISHSMGYETKYCHLDKVLVSKGDSVGAGCLVAKSGNSGRSTGPHLHYAIMKDGEPINPSELIGR